MNDRQPPAQLPRDPEQVPPGRFWQKAYAASVFYPTLGWNMLLGRVLKIRRWWDYIDDCVIVGARPLRRDVATLQGLGVRAVVNTCQEYRGPVVEYQTHHIEQLHIPTTDFTHPRLDDIVTAVAFVQRHVEKRHLVYIHCKAGRARSATVALCWLIAHRGMTPEAAQSLLLEKRSHVNSHLTQRPVVAEFLEHLRRDSSPPASTKCDRRGHT